MEFVIGFGIGVLIALIARRRKKRQMQLNSGTKHLGRHKKDEELITVILPTINDNDKQP